MDIDNLQDLHAHSREDSWDNSAGKFDLGIGHESIEANEEERQEDIGQIAEQMAHHRPQHLNMAHLSLKGCHIKRQTYRDNKQYREEQKHCQIIGKRADDRARIAHLPDVIEGLFDIVHQHQHGVKHEDQSNA